MGSKTRTTMRTDLRTDLKDSGALWSDAELNRCIERAFSDLSRYLPRELIYEESLQFTVTSDSFTTPLDTDIDRIVDNESLTGKASGDSCTVDGQPDVPRPLTATITDANDTITGLVITISGFDDKDQSATEILTYAVGQSKTLTGKQYFKYVSSVVLSQVGGTTTGDTLEIGIGAYTTVWVSLDYKPIKWASETASTGTRNTDFYMDYANGRIKAISGGLLAANTAYTISYKKSQIAIDLSALAGFIRVHQVEYPVGDVPQNIAQQDIFANLLFITGSGESEGQDYLAEDEHLRVYYDAKHIPPGDYSPGTAPDFLEDTILMASAAYALLVYALKYEHQAVTDFASARTELEAIAHTALGTALTNAATQIAAAATALGKINSDSGRVYLTDADTALDNAASALAKVATYLENNTGEDAKSRLTKITTDIASLRTAITTAQDAANSELDAGDFSAIATHLTAAGAALDKVTTYLETNTNENSKFWLTKITTDIAGLRTAIGTALDALNAYLDSVATDLTAADSARANYMGATANYVDGATAPGIKKYLDDGDAALNTVAVGGEGQDVPRAYREYAQTTRDGLVAPHERDREFKAQNATFRTNAAMIYAQEAAQRLSNLSSYIEQSEGWGRIAAGFIGEAVQRITEAGQIVNREAVVATQAAGYIQEAASRLDNLRSYVEQAEGWGRIAAGFVSEANTRIAEAAQRVGIADRYLGEASQRNASAEAYIAEANSRLADMDRYISEADRYVSIATQNLALADRFRTEALERRNEVYSIWRDRKQYIGDFTSSSTRQMPQ